MILIDDGDRGIVQLLRIALRLRHHCDREGIDDESEQNPIAEEAAQLLRSEPEDIRKLAHGPSLLLLAEKKQADRGETRNEERKGSQVPREIREPKPLRKCPDADR